MQGAKRQRASVLRLCLAPSSVLRLRLAKCCVLRLCLATCSVVMAFFVAQQPMPVSLTKNDIVICVVLEKECQCILSFWTGNGIAPKHLEVLGEHAEHGCTLSTYMLSLVCHSDCQHSL